MKQVVINHRNRFSYKLLAVIMFELPDPSLVIWLENGGVRWGIKHNFHIL
jgi:hypothetical protein